jgi:hypothetical protein
MNIKPKWDDRHALGCSIVIALFFVGTIITYYGGTYCPLYFLIPAVCAGIYAFIAFMAWADG